MFNSQCNPNVWEVNGDMLDIKDQLTCKCWTFTWISKVANHCADNAEKIFLFMLF